ncbi:OmpA domain-containing protein [Nitratireductor indicus C115]|uniref:OmpA domain-containing protein n=1 Tax=Nitratireductor indicus C115 TaxID=1231190 RepID=K2N370_9HYPH|nr:OmpA family protein [Nitratireductor indicus]EKF41873.1 OmpA domain-containing protein [Nitratireductor indicus C115]SFQ66421.1 OmpA-OmpF porin, OOP family [Nitratireductor indicus]
MRAILGVVVLSLGTVGLGYWAQGHNAVRMETMIGEGAAQAVGETVHPLEIGVSGRDIHVSGVADNTGEKEHILAALDAVEGRRVVTENLRVLEKVSPFTTQVTKESPDAPLALGGYVPSESARAALGIANGAGSLQLASGAPENWEQLARAGVEVLGFLRKGQMTLADGKLTIVGEAASAEDYAMAEKALSQLPAEMVTQMILKPDRGQPAGWHLEYDAATGATVSGALPAGMNAEALAGALGLDGIAGTPTQIDESGAEDMNFLATLRGWLDRVERLTLDVSPEMREARIEVQGDVDADMLKKELAGSGLATEVSVVTPEGSNGATRVNAASRMTQRYMGGFWLALPEIRTDRAGCQAAADDVLDRISINFVTASDKLDTGAVRAINELARFMVQCSEETGLKAEIGGHTDNVGDEAANLDLSQRRATAVGRELIVRGVAADRLNMRGYGMSKPIADNGTEQGRAKNRRTTVTWTD